MLQDGHPDVCHTITGVLNERVINALGEDYFNDD